MDTITAIDVSPHRKGTVYISGERHRVSDRTPYLYKTTDYGKTWNRITNGIRENDYSWVIREDPVRPGLLYAGTETGAYVSFDAGASWQSLQRNLPPVMVMQMLVKDDDLVVATHGRGFWIMDNISSLRAITPEVVSAPVHLFEVVPALRQSRGGGGYSGRSDAARNPPRGVMFEYHLAQAATSEVMFTITDAAGEIISVEEEELPGIAVSIASLSPVLTLDWDCHGEIWFGLNVTGQVAGGPETRYSVQQGDVVQFAQSVSISAPEQGIEQVSNLIFGYDRATGRLVLVQTVTQGTVNGEPFIVEMVQQLLPDEFAGPADVGRTPDSEPGEIPDGIADLIERLEAEPVADPPASVTQYAFRGETVYYVPPRCCDVYGTLYNRDGLIVGHPEGGFTGDGDGRLPDFFEGRSDPKVLWEDSRTRGPDLVQVLAPIDRLEIQAAAIEPPQYRVLVDSVLPDSCAFFDGFSVDQIGETIRIRIFNVRPADPDVECDQVASRVNVEITLGAGFETGVDYTIDVNGTIRTFTAE